MHKLRQEYATRVGIDPTNQYAHRRHRKRERHEKRQTIGSMRRRCPQMIDNRQMPQRPQHTQQHGGTQSVALHAHEWERIAHPANFLKEPSWNRKQDTQQELIRRIDRREDGLQRQQDA